MKTALTLAMLQAACGKVILDEKFADKSKWTESKWKGESEMSTMTLEAPANAPDDKALKTTTDARFYGSSTTFEETELKGKNLLVQYEATYDNDINCGGGYLKMGPKMEDATKFGDPTEYAMMFGPDKCGMTKRTHLIFNYKGKNVLKKVDLPYAQDETGIATIYRVVVGKDNSVEVFIDGESKYKGKMEDDWDLLEPKEIDDPDDKKPSDWVDEAMIDDPEDKKPADWVEEKEIVDKDAKQPEDWDEEEDGTWEAPMIPNPDYKGEWSAKRISNPAYKGVWAPKKIENPKYEPDTELYLMNKKPIAFLGFDLWQVKSGSSFDNILVSVDEDMGALTKEADAALEAWKTKKEAMKKLKDSTTTTTTTTSEAAEVDDDDDKDDKSDTEDL